MVGSGQDLRMRELLDTLKELRDTIETLRKELSIRDKKIANQEEQISYLLNKLYGKSSEKRSFVVDGQLGFFNEVETEAAKEADPEPDAEEETPVPPTPASKPRKPKTPKEKLLKGVKVTEKVIELPEEESV